MDLETENRLAQMLLEEARRLRLEADKEGALAYLRKHNVRSRPNSRFLTATVLGVEQANRAADVSEMWRAREKEVELWTATRRRVNKRDLSERGKHKFDLMNADCSSSRGGSSRDSTNDSEDASGLEDRDVEEFLYSRVKRGRGGVGPRMDEPGPFLPPPSNGGGDDLDADVRVREEWESRVLGPEKPSFLRSRSPDVEATDQKCSRKDVSAYKKHHHHKRKERSSEEKEKEEKRSKHHRHRHRHKHHKE